MTSTNFIIANIKLLIEISENGKYKIHEDRTHIDFHPCDELPPIRKNENGENIMQSIIDIVSSSTNKIKWDNSDTNNNSKKEEEDDEDDEDDDDDEDDEDDEDEDEDDEDEDDEDDEDSEEKNPDTDTKDEDEDEEEEEELKVYKSEINTNPKQNSLTTTLKNNYVKHHITKKQR
jgi:hypothetical protein